MMNISNDNGFSLAEVMLVAAMLSLLGMIMFSTVVSTRDVSVTVQSTNTVSASLRAIGNMMERDIRMAGAGLYKEYFKKEAKDGFDYNFNFSNDEGDADAMILPPLEVTNGTDDEIASYMNQIDQVFGITSDFREPETDIITLYYSGDSIFQGTIDAYSGKGQENFGETDMENGERMFEMFNRLGQRPMLIFVIDDLGNYATMRTLTNISKQGQEYSIKMEPSADYNLPSNMKGFFDDMYGKNNLPPNATSLSNAVEEDHFAQLKMVTYFVYSHPDPAEDAQGWLVRLDLASYVASGGDIDATDPDTVRPYVVAENVSDFQVAIGVDVNNNDILEDDEWINDEDMETYSNNGGGDGTVGQEYLDLLNNLRTVRFSLVSHTDDIAERNTYGFVDPGSGAFSSQYPNVGTVAGRIGVTPVLEDHVWTTTALTNRLWYRRAVQQGRMVKIRNMDLNATFSR